MPDEPRLPAEKELSQLPRWAVVAFAARCARRVQPLYKALWPDAPPEHVSALDIAITRAERAASAAAYTTLIIRTARAVTVHAAPAAVRAAVRAAAGAADAAAGAAYAAYAGHDAHDAAYVARATAATHDAARAAACAARATAAAHDAARAAARAGATAQNAAVTAMRRDLDRLFEAARRETWTDRTPVPPQFFDLLWPGGEPEGWPYRKPEGTDEARTARPPGEAVIEVYIDPGEASKETIQAVLEGLGDLHRAAGGLGLEFHSEGLTLCAWEGVRT